MLLLDVALLLLVFLAAALSWSRVSLSLLLSPFLYLLSLLATILLLSSLAALSVLSPDGLSRFPVACLVSK
jgi:hypothetical protein